MAYQELIKRFDRIRDYMREFMGSVKKFVCLDIPKPNSIIQHDSGSEHSSPLPTLPLGAGCNI